MNWPKDKSTKLLLTKLPLSRDHSHRSRPYIKRSRLSALRRRDGERIPNMNS